MRFLFVHGGFHASWCWERTIAELAALGHDGVAVDLPGHGALVDQESTLANRRDAIVALMQPGDVLVGHSGGGFDATLAAVDLPAFYVDLRGDAPAEVDRWRRAPVRARVISGVYDPAQITFGKREAT